MKSLLPSRRKPPPSPPPIADPPEPPDAFSRLPIELILLIFSHLPTPASILAALNVSQTWRALLSLPDIYRPLASRLLPSVPTQLLPSAQAFHAALRSHHLRSSGFFSSAAHRTLALDDALLTPVKQPSVAVGGVHDLFAVAGLDLDDEHNARLKLHSHGRVAWWPEAWILPYFAVVDDLRAGTRRMYLFPGQEPGLVSQAMRGWKTAMGACLFLMGQDVGVCVWHLERDEMQWVGLPGAFERCVVEGERVLFVGRRAGGVWLWRWGDEQVKVVDADGLGCYPPGPGPVAMGGQVNFGQFHTGSQPPDPRPGSKIGLRFRDSDVKLDFILHPTDADVLFVVTYDDNDLVVYEIVAGKLGDTITLPYHHIAARILRASRRNNAVHYIRHERCDGHGGYCLITAWLGSRVPEDPICPGCHSDECPGSNIGSVCFNVYTKEFTAFVHHASYAGTPDVHLWDGLLAVGASGIRGRSGDLEALVALLHPCDGRLSASLGEGDEVKCLRVPRGTTKEVVKFTSYRPNMWDVVHRPMRFDGVACVLATDGWPLAAWPSGVALDIEKPEWLSGDGNTLMYVVGKDYAIWTFGEGEIASGARGEDKKGKPWKERWRSVTRLGAGGSSRKGADGSPR